MGLDRLDQIGWAFGLGMARAGIQLDAIVGSMSDGRGPSDKLGGYVIHFGILNA